MANKPQPGVLERALRDGTLHRLAQQCASQRELAERIGLSKDAFISQKCRLLAKGVAVPSFEELRLSQNVISANSNVVAQDSTAQNYTVGSVSCGAGPVYSNLSNGAGAVIGGNLDRPFAANDNRWPNLAAFENEQHGSPTSGSAIYRTAFDSETRHTRKLTRQDCPDGTLMLWASDIHIPIHNEPACRLMVECAERAGVSRVIAGGDILDMNCLSKHAKEARRSVEHATILEEVEPGRWLLDWFAKKRTTLILGNHELRLERFVDENPAFHGSVASNLAHVANLPAEIEVIDGEVRLGNLSMFHGHAEFKNGTGGKYPSQKILDMFPDQSSIHGHLHRSGTAYRTTRDEDGVHRTRRAYSMPHLSYEHMHYNYVSRNPNWQTGFGLIRVWWEDDRPRWTVYQVEVLFDRNGRPYFEFEGHLYR